jgi:DNA polymerase-3 subunit alpha
MILSGKNCKAREARHLDIGDFIMTTTGYKKIVAINSSGVGNCYDISLLRDGDLFLDEPNFVLSSGIISHNCNLPIVSDCIALIEKNRGIKIRRCDIPIDDRRTIHLASKKDLVGIFQLDNPSTKSVVDAVEMESLLDVAAVTSLIRPGPRDMGMDMEYAKRKHGEPYEAPDILKKLLADTYGVIVFQEQAMKIAQVIGGLAKPDSYRFLKAIAKKKPELMASYKDKFFAGAQRMIDSGDLTIQDIETIWGNIVTFAGYAFNMGHATCYSALSTTELWLKLNYPIEYMCALINNTKLGKKKHGQDVFSEYISYARRSGIDVLPPNVSKSKTSFTIDDGKILFSIGHVKNVSSMASVIESFQPFASMEDFYNRAKIDTTSKKTGKTNSRRPNKKVVESLIEAGAFDSFNADRNALMTEYYRLRGVKKEVPPQYTEKQWLEREIEATGLCLSAVPLCRQHAKEIEDNKLKLISEITGKKVRVFGMIEEIKAHTSKTGNPMYIVRITDGFDKLSFFVFKAGQQFFKDKYKHAGTIGGFPLDKFEDGDARFFNDRGEPVVFVKPPAPAVAQKVVQDTVVDA